MFGFFVTAVTEEGLLVDARFTVVTVVTVVAVGGVENIFFVVLELLVLSTQSPRRHHCKLLSISFLVCKEKLKNISCYTKCAFCIFTAHENDLTLAPPHWVPSSAGCDVQVK